MSSSSKSSKPARSSVRKAKAKDVSNVVFDYTRANLLIKAGRVDKQQLIFLERFLKKAKQDPNGVL